MGETKEIKGEDFQLCWIIKNLGGGGGGGRIFCFVGTFVLFALLLRISPQGHNSVMVFYHSSRAIYAKQQNLKWLSHISHGLFLFGKILRDRGCQFCPAC